MSYKSNKNSMVSDLYKKFGFTKTEDVGEDTVWELIVANHNNKNKFIGVNNEQN